jgi:beta-galactosidase
MNAGGRMQLRLLFASAIACLVSLTSVALAKGARADIPQGYYVGADLSYVNEMEDCGVQYRDRGKPADPFTLLQARGANLVRVRLWNDAKWTRYSNLADVKKTIRRARQSGMQVLLDFHYSDDWADGEKQIVPAAWAQIADPDRLAQTLYDFTLRTLRDLDREGLMPQLVQVGNETNVELLSTLERAKQPINWARNAKLFNAGIRAVRDAGAQASIKPRVMLHIAQPENVEPWFAAAKAAGVTDYDLIGISYYRRWSTQDLDGLEAVIRRLRRQYAADVLLVEVAYPWTLENADQSNNLLGTSTLIAGYPATPDGQRRYLIDLTQRVISSGGVGVVYWEPAWVSSKCKTRWATGSAWDNATLFDHRGEPLPGADFFAFPYVFAAKESRDHVVSSPPQPEVSGNFNRGWRFHRFERETAEVAADQVPATAWETVTLPHTARIEPRIVNDQWQGIALYRKEFAAEPAWRGKRVWLRFEAAMNIARVSVNGKEVLTHLGGYLPFVVDLSERLRFDAPNVVSVWLDNRDNAITGPKAMHVLDFNMYGGLYRDATLIVKEPLHITDEMLANQPAGGGVFVTYPEVNRQQASVAVKTQVRNEGRAPAIFRVVQTLWRDRQQVTSAMSSPLSVKHGAAADVNVELKVPQPQLWSPHSPALYDLVTAVEVDGKIVDQRRTRIGIRRVEFDGAKFKINGDEMFLRGVNRHQEYPYVGYAVSRAADYRDARRIKEAGFDFVRLSHYPQSPYFMAAADELGLVLLNSVLGWQFYNDDPRFEQQVVQTCRDLVRRDRNHPSAILWECSLNESQMPKTLVQKFQSAVHEEYPGNQAFSAGWQNDGYDIYIQARQHRIEHYRPPDRPYLVSEYGDWEYYALNAGFNQQAWANLQPDARTSRQLLSAGEARLLQQAMNNQEGHNDNFNTPAFADAYWAMFDYNRGYAEDLEASGPMTLDRVPKFSYYFFRTQRDAAQVSELYAAGPEVFIASYWQPDSATDVRVYGNVDEVELLLNGRSVGRQRPDADRISNHLRHPPFTFKLGKFTPGSLEAIGYIAGRSVAHHRVITPEAIHRIEIEFDTAGICADAERDDQIFVRARLLDDNGTTVAMSGHEVEFSASGRFSVIGPTQLMTEAGIATALLRVAPGPGEAKVSVSSGVQQHSASYEDTGCRRVFPAR